MYLAFIPACQALFSVGWLHRKLKYNQKIVCWTWRVTLSICMLSASSHITWCVPPSDMVSDMPGKLDVWARGSEPLLPGVVLEVSCHIWINSFFFCILMTKTFPHPLFLKCVCDSLVLPDSLGKKRTLTNSTLPIISSFVGSLCSLKVLSKPV